MRRGRQKILHNHLVSTKSSATAAASTAAISAKRNTQVAVQRSLKSQKLGEQNRQHVQLELTAVNCQQCTHAPLAAAAKVVKTPATVPALLAAIPGAIGEAPAAPAATTAAAAAVTIPRDSAFQILRRCCRCHQVLTCQHEQPDYPRA